MKWTTRGLVIVMLTGWTGYAQAQNHNTHGSLSTNNSNIKEEEFALQIGEQRVLSSDGVQSYSEGTKGVVDVRLTKNASQFIIVALKPGLTTVLFLMTDGTERHYKITVTDPNESGSKSPHTGVVSPRETIRLDFYFVQVTRTENYQVGIKWPGQVAPIFNASYNIKGGQLDSASAIITNQALPRLDLAQTGGWAKILKQAAVVTANGERAEFSGGGEYNIKISSAMSTGVQKIPYGSTITVEPNYDPKTGRIEIRLHADVSELDTSTSADVPGRITAALDTLVNLELGQSLVLAGLTARSERTTKSGLPILSQIPILGVFFGSHAHDENESENIILIVPSVVDSISMQARERLDYALKSYDDYSGHIDRVDFLPPPTLGKPSAKQP